MIIAGILFFVVMAIAAFVVFKLLKKAVKMAVRAVIVFLILFIGLAGGLAFWAFGGGGAPAKAPASKKTR